MTPPAKRKFAAFLQGDVKRQRHKQRVEEAVAEIKGAEMVALDLEFSGLFMHGKKQKTVEEYYLHCADSVPRFLAVQLGLCAAKRDPKNPDKWIMSPFNFHLFPSRRKVFMCDSLSLSWLLHQGFDLKKWIEDGYDYGGLASLQNDVASSSSFPGTEILNDSGAQKLVEAIIEDQVPVVLHNGLLDLLHLFEKFIGDLPQSLAHFCEQINDFFSGGIYDTKHIAEEGRTKVFRLSDTSRGATSLDALRFHLSKRKSSLEFAVNCNLTAVKAGEMAGYHFWVPGIPHLTSDRSRVPKELHPKSAGAEESESVQQPSDSAAPVGGTQPSSATSHSSPVEEEEEESYTDAMASDKAHEAGYDAMITLQVFLLELEWVRKSGEFTPGMDTGDLAVVPRDWSKYPFCLKVVNEIEVVGIAPGKISLSGEKSSCYNNHITIVNEVTDVISSSSAGRRPEIDVDSQLPIKRVPNSNSINRNIVAPYTVPPPSRRGPRGLFRNLQAIYNQSAENDATTMTKS